MEPNKVFCDICLEHLHNKIKNLSCNHKLHLDCYNDLLIHGISNNSQIVLCPLCKKNIYLRNNLEKCQLYIGLLLIIFLFMIKYFGFILEYF